MDMQPGRPLLTELQGSAMEERKSLEEEITAGQLPNEPVQVYVRRYQNLLNLLNKAHGQWTFENMEARKRQRQQRVRACPPNLNSYNPKDPQHTTRPDVVCKRRDRPDHTQQQCVAMRHANGLRILDDTTPTSTMNDPARY
eukprot:jgi/Tetstr1/445539/TSEL_033313.t1